MKNLHEFSKKVIFLMILVWFIGVVFGLVCVGVQVIRGDYTTNLADVLMYVGAPVTGGIISYLLKSAWEKKETIKQAAATGNFRSNYLVENNLSEDILKKVNEV